VVADAARGWTDFAVATAGAAAGLTGLLFVAVSINLTRILKFPGLPGRAGSTLGLLLTLLVVSLFLLAPSQTDRLVGIEIAVTGSTLAALVATVAARSRRPSTGDQPGLPWVKSLIVIAPAILLVVGGVSVAVAAGGGLYWVLAAMVAGFVGAVLNAWVLLVEIER
jgi:hypothetical protein